MRSAMITDVIEDAFRATGYTAADIDWFVPHQANKRIIDGSAHKLGIRAGEGRHHRRPARQYLGGLDSAGACRRGRGRAHQARAIWCCWRPWAAASPGAAALLRW